MALLESASSPHRARLPLCTSSATAHARDPRADVNRGIAMAATPLARDRNGGDLSGRRLATAIVTCAFAAAFAASLLAQSGTKQILVAVGAAAVGVVLLFVRDRALAVVLLLVLNLQFLFHKSFGAINPDVVSGAPSLYLTNVYVLLAVLYVLWFADGT